jgi:hypothetical protein
MWNNPLSLVLATVVLTVISLSPEAQAASEKNRYTHPACTNSQPNCGVIVYGNAGGYDVDPVELKAKRTQPSGVQANPACAGIDVKFKNGLALGQYDTFVVPTPCAYHLEIQITAGKNKDRDLYLTRGCQIETKTDGTTLQNDWHVSVGWTKKAKDQGMSGPPQDATGNKCGTLGNM